MRLRSTRYLIALTTMWAALSFHWTILGNNVLPTRALARARACHGRWFGDVTRAFVAAQVQRRWVSRRGLL